MPNSYYPKRFPKNDKIPAVQDHNNDSELEDEIHESLFSDDQHKEQVDDMEDDEEEEKRAITYEMEKNTGLIPKRQKSSAFLVSNIARN